MDIYERKLMLVDDNQELLEMIADILRHSGYKNIVKAKCVQEALTVFQMEKPGHGSFGCDAAGWRRISAVSEAERKLRDSHSFSVCLR